MGGKRRRGRSRPATPKQPTESPTEPSEASEWHGRQIAAGILGNVLLLGLFAYAAVASRYWRNLYLQSVAEDGPLEWLTFWALIAATAFFLWATVLERRRRKRAGWFLGFMAISCALVAMEEISWGQRLLGYKPPRYFLENNSHLEANFHNTIPSGLRQVGMLALLATYGVLLPLLACVPRSARWLDRAAIHAPPIWIVPAFVVAFLAFYLYPWSFSGEIVELVLGLSLLFAGMHHVSAFRRKLDPPRDPMRFGRLTMPIGMTCSTLFLSFVAALSSSFVGQRPDAGPDTKQQTNRELAALMNDLLLLTAERGFDVPCPCGSHCRLRSFIESGGLREMYDGHFSALQRAGLPADRAEFFLDPWHSSYWLWHEACSGDEDEPSHTVLIYSCGPNRRRDSTLAGISGDDIGKVVVIDRPLWEIIARQEPVPASTWRP